MLHHQELFPKKKFRYLHIIRRFLMRCQNSTLNTHGVISEFIAPLATVEKSHPRYPSIIIDHIKPM